MKYMKILTVVKVKAVEIELPGRLDIGVEGLYLIQSVSNGHFSSKSECQYVQVGYSDMLLFS